MEDVRITIKPDAQIGTISPRLYGHFAEHLGRCCYDGLFLKPTSASVPNQKGFRTDVLEALKNMPMPLLRWPGGCYADHYHWRDGIGPVEQRPRRLGMSCGETVEDDNRLGTHEFLWFCEQTGAEPYLAGNVGTGSPQEMCDWLEYCNSALDTTLTRLRRANGAEKPFGVKLWGVGNENWGCGGNFDARDYALEYRRYATMLRHVDPHVELVACGFDEPWNRTLLQTLRNHVDTIDHLSVHRYWHGDGGELDPSERVSYRLFTEAALTEAFIQQTADIIRVELGERRRVGVALDEWGIWHPEARLQFNPSTRGGPYEQVSTLRDALAAALVLEGFHRQCRVLSLANLAQVVNVLHAPIQTRGAAMWRTPTYHVFQLHAPHIGATALEVEVQASLLPHSDELRCVTATASLDKEDNLTLTILNLHLDQSATVHFGGIEGRVLSKAQLLTADSPLAHNSAERPNAVEPQPIKATESTQGGYLVNLPKHSMATFRLKRK